MTPKEQKRSNHFYEPMLRNSVYPSVALQAPEPVCCIWNGSRVRKEEGRQKRGRNSFTRA